LDAFEDSLHDELEGLAEVERTEWGPDLAVVDVEPYNPQSALVTWIDMGRGLVLTVGEAQHARWELDLSQDNLNFLEAAVRAAIDGRVSCTLSKHEDEVEIVHVDGRVEATAGSDLWPSLLRWRRSKRHVQYEPYALGPTG
jgi:hypothetical protein